jgi:hypothetical protein
MSLRHRKYSSMVRCGAQPVMWPGATMMKRSYIKPKSTVRPTRKAEKHQQRHQYSLREARPIPWTTRHDVHKGRMVWLARPVQPVLNTE